MWPVGTRRAFITGALGTASICRAADLWLPITRTTTNLAVVPIFIGETLLHFVADTGAANSLIALEALTRLAPGDFESGGTSTQTFGGGQATAQTNGTPVRRRFSSDGVRLAFSRACVTNRRKLRDDRLNFCGAQDRPLTCSDEVFADLSRFRRGCLGWP